MTEAARVASPEAFPSQPPVIEAGASFEGLLAFPDDTLVAGTLQGEVYGHGQLEICASGCVEGRVEAEVVAVAGTLIGQVEARSALEVLAGGRVAAQVKTPQLRVADGGRVDGHVQMREAPAGGAGTSNP